MSLPLKLADLRKEAGLTQMELAEKLDVSRQAISKWEVGAAVPGTDKLKALSELYGVSIDYLLDDEVVTPPKRDEGQTGKKEELTHITKTAKHVGILLGVIGALIIALMVVILLCVVKIRRLERPDGFPIEDLSCEQLPNDYSIETFHLIPMD